MGEFDGVCLPADWYVYTVQSVEIHQRCLCAVLGGGAASLGGRRPSGVNATPTRALQLPGKCKIQTPPVSQCNGN